MAGFWGGKSGGAGVVRGAVFAMSGMGAAKAVRAGEETLCVCLVHHDVWGRGSGTTLEKFTYGTL